MSNCKKMSVMLVAMLAFFCLTVSVSSAIDCAEATITKIGFNSAYDNATTSGTVIQLTCAGTAWSGTVSVQFYLTKAAGDQGLATLLTAFAMDKPVWVRTSGATGGSLLQIVYVNR
jgi:hypothetical protein